MLLAVASTRLLLTALVLEASGCQGCTLFIVGFAG